MARKAQEMRRKAELVEPKNTQRPNATSSPSNAATSIKNNKIPFKNSTSETLSGRQTPSRKRTATASEKVTAAIPAAQKDTTSADCPTRPKKNTPPKKVVLAKKAIVAKTTRAAKEKDAARRKILTKAKLVKAKNTTRTSLTLKRPIRVERNKVCTPSSDFFSLLILSLL